MDAGSGFWPSSASMMSVVFEERKFSSACYLSVKVTDATPSRPRT